MMNEDVGGTSTTYDIDGVTHDIQAKTTTLRRLREEITAQLSDARANTDDDEEGDSEDEHASNSAPSSDASDDDYTDASDDAYGISRVMQIRVSESLTGDVDRRAASSSSSSSLNGYVSLRRIQVDADLEVKLRRLELRKVDLELKLAHSWEKVELARQTLEEAEEIHGMYAVEFAVATKEFEMQQDLVYDELERKEEEAKAKQLAALQAAAMRRAD